MNLLNLLNQQVLQKEIDKISKNQFQILPFTIDETMSPVLNYKDLVTGSEWTVKIPSIIDSESFLINFFSDKIRDNRNSKLKNILD